MSSCRQTRREPIPVFRQILEPITMTAVEEKGKRFYRPTGTAKGAEMLDRLGAHPGRRFRSSRGPEISNFLVLEIDVI
jgi:hypothetical protein